MKHVLFFFSVHLQYMLVEVDDASLHVDEKANYGQFLSVIFGALKIC